MKIRTFTLLMCACLVLVVGTAAAYAAPTTAATAILGTVQTLSGGEYRLTSVTWQAPVIAQGERYVLLAPELRPAETMLRGNGCCCTYLPCIQR